MKTAIFLFDVLVLFGVICVPPFVLADGGFDFDQFDKMDQATRYQLADAALQTREAALSNLSFELKTHSEYLDKGKMVPSTDEDQVIMMLDGRVWEHYKWLNLQLPTMPKEYWTVGGDNYWREYGIATTNTGRLLTTGTINTIPRPYENQFFEMLGIGHLQNVHRTNDRYLSIARDTPSGWLETIWQDAANDAKERIQHPEKIIFRSKKTGETFDFGCTVTIGKEWYVDNSGRGRWVIDVRWARQMYGTTDCFLDPNMGFMRVYQEYAQYGVINKNLDKGLREHIWEEVTKVETISGVEIPTHGYRIGLITLTNARDKHVFDLVGLSIGTVKPQDVADTTVQFTPKSYVIDYIKRKSYYINPDGSYTPIGYFDENIGKMIEPTTEPTTKPAINVGGVGN
jgi:hypothetical protein